MASSGIARSRLARLSLDFSELLSSSYDGVSIHVDDANMYKFCLHLCPNSGPYKGLRLHFDVQLPETVSPFIPPAGQLMKYSYILVARKCP
jgi:ubiquitin-protein ligase